jgi:succinate-semialdehyde dehydrogenase / glutarate-semialdehyde dehydrogenase
VSAIRTLNPATGEVEAEFEPHTDAEVEERIAAAEAAARELRHTDFATRAGWMKTTADLMDTEVESSAVMLVREMGKTIGQARAEVAKCANALRFYAERAEGFLADEPLEDPGTVGASAAWTHYEPMGVVLAVMPWNYPLWQVIRFAAPALMAGNSGLLKHASNVPQSALYLDSLFERGGFPRGSFGCLFIGVAKIEDVVRDRRIAAVTLTGSEPAGRSLASIAGSEVKKSVLELGGSDPFIVMPSADVAEAAAVAITARVNNNGQSCVAGKRFIVHDDVYDEFVGAFAARMTSLKVGDPMDEATEVGPVATASVRDELVALVEDASRHGATVRVGPEPLPEAGWYVRPTVVEGVTPEMRLFGEETFGPVASVFRAGSREEIAALANATTFGLSSSVWTGEVDDEEYFVRELEAGAVFVNGMTVSHPELPFGGVKDSGIGRELAAEGIREFCNLKTIWRR